MAGQVGRVLRDHVLAGGVGRAATRNRALRITAGGAAGIEKTFGLTLEAR